MAKKRRKRSVFFICLLLSISKLANTADWSRSNAKCSSVTVSDWRSQLQNIHIFQICDNTNSCDCSKNPAYSKYCYFGVDCEGCLYNGHERLCKQYEGKSEKPKKLATIVDKSKSTQDCPSNIEFWCGDACKYKHSNKVCDGKCIPRYQLCKTSDEPCEVQHDSDATDWKCGDKCTKDSTEEESSQFDCGGVCKPKFKYKQCGNKKCVERKYLCEEDDEPCEVNHDDDATDWKCGRICVLRKSKEESLNFDCGGMCKLKSYYKECKNGECIKKSETCSDEISEEISTTLVTLSTTADNPTEINEPTEDIKSESNNDEDPDMSNIIVAVVSILVLMAIVIVVVFFIKKQKGGRKKSLAIKFIPGDIPEHRVLEKNDDLLDTISQAAKEKTPNKEEFKVIQEYVRVNINEAKAIGMQEENKNRNRYHDILPYDSNIVNLKKPTGDPPLTYMSASMINFPDFGQNFIAIQAPKENMFSSFWQMIHEQEISTIVMITGLVEGRKTKAHKYWPDMEDPDFELDNGFKLKYITHSFHGTYYQRQITLTDANGKERNIEQLQTTAWLDMTAPKDTKVLLDLIYKARELAGDPNMKNTAKRKSISPKTKRSKKCPILVHCSAGVGRTGTFIALYKLVADYDNERVKTLDLFSTVVKMREQRMNMVQKYEQYHYIIKCLHHYIIAQTDIYQA